MPIRFRPRRGLGQALLSLEAQRLQALETGPLSRCFCVTLIGFYIGTAQLQKVLDPKTGPPRGHQIQPVEGQVLDPRAKETYLKGSESGTSLCMEELGDGF